MGKKVKNKKECRFYAQGGYCCPRVMCGEGRDKCNTIAHCGYGRTRCHIGKDSDICIMFVKRDKKSETKSKELKGTK